MWTACIIILLNHDHPPAYIDFPVAESTGEHPPAEGIYILHVYTAELHGVLFTNRSWHCFNYCTARQLPSLDCPCAEVSAAHDIATLLSSKE